MPDRKKDVRRFQRAAAQRLTAANLLLKNGFNLETTYLAGYAVECSLKALILRRSPRGRHTEMMEKLTKVGAKGHDFEYLKNILKKLLTGSERTKDVDAFPAKVYNALARVATWSTDLRYEVGLVETRTAQLFLEAAEAIREWMERS
jgi:HEPN domain-containing protein